MSILNSSDFIGNSLSAINNITEDLDSRTYYMSLSSDYLFSPLKIFIDDHLSDFRSLITTTMANSSKWVDMTTDVSTNSAKWVKPIVFVSKNLYLDPITPTSFYSVTAEFAQKYPVFITEYPEFVENQKAYIYYYTYISINRLNYTQTKNSNLHWCACPPSYTLVVNCNDSSSGSVNCDNGSFSCGSCATSCSQSATVPCYYENGSTGIYRYISANINAYFDDRYEKTINCAMFEIKNCEWRFSKYII